MFKVGDKVITSLGEIGVITGICDCDKCKERGFLEPQVKTELGTGHIWITDTDKENGFSSFYQIGEQVYGNLDDTELICDIAKVKRQIKEKQEELEELEKQLEFVGHLRKKELFKSCWGKKE